MGDSYVRAATLDVLDAEDESGGMDIVCLGEPIGIFYCPLLDIE